MATRRKKKPRFDLMATASDYLLNRSMRERATAKENAGKKALMEFMEANGDALLDEPVGFVEYKKGKPVERTIGGFVRQERKSSSLDEEKVMALLREKDLVEDCTYTERHVDEDKVMAANFDGRLTDKEVQDCFTHKTTYALILDDHEEEGDDVVEETEWRR